MPPVKLSLHYVGKVRTKQDTSETTSTTSRVRSRQPVLRSLHFGSTSESLMAPPLCAAFILTVNIFIFEVASVVILVVS